MNQPPADPQPAATGGISNREATGKHAAHGAINSESGGGAGVADRSWVATEARNPASARLHEMSPAEIVALMQDADAAVMHALRAARPSLISLIESLASRFIADAAPSDPGRLIYLGAGTSGRLGVLDASEAPPTFCVQPGRIVGLIAGGDTALRRSSEGAEDDPDGARPVLDELRLTDRDGVVGIAAGGTTPWVLGALKIARQAAPDGITGLIVCAPVEKPPWVDHLVVLETGPEVLTGSTRLKAGTATKMALNQISTTLMVLSGRVHENLMVDVRATNAKLRDRAARIVRTLCPDLSRDDALALVDLAGGSAKVAVVMSRRGVDRDQALAMLNSAGGRLAGVIQ